MKIEKKHWIIIGIVVAIILVWYFFLRKKKSTTSNYKSIDPANITAPVNQACSAYVTDFVIKIKTCAAMASPPLPGQENLVTLNRNCFNNAINTLKNATNVANNIGYN